MYPGLLVIRIVEVATHTTNTGGIMDGNGQTKNGSGSLVQLVHDGVDESVPNGVIVEDPHGAQGHLLVTGAQAEECAQVLADKFASSSFIRVGFEDVAALLGDGIGRYGRGSASGENLAVQAGDRALGIVLHGTDPETVCGVIIDITASDDMSLGEVIRAVGHIQSAVALNASCIFGLDLDSSYGDQMQVDVICVGGQSDF